MEGYCKHCGQHGQISRRGVCPACAEERIRANTERLRQKTNVTPHIETEKPVALTEAPVPEVPKNKNEPAKAEINRVHVPEEDQEKPEPRSWRIW